MNVFMHSILYATPLLITTAKYIRISKMMVNRNVQPCGENYKLAI
jgi:hypothetical protein